MKAVQFQHTVSLEVNRSEFKIIRDALICYKDELRKQAINLSADHALAVDFHLGTLEQLREKAELLKIMNYDLIPIGVSLSVYENMEGESK